MRHFLCAVAFFFFHGLSLLEAQGILIGWDFPVNSTVTSASSAITDTGVVGPKSFAMANGLSPNIYSSNPYAWGGSSWTAGGTLPGPNATTNNDYFFFEIEAATGKKITITGISRLILQVSASGPKRWSLLYSEGNSNSAFDPSPLRNYGPFDVVNPANTGEILDTDITAQVNAAISANPIVLTAGKIGFFRLVGFGGTGTSGSGRIVANAPAGMSDFALTGIVEEMPKTSQTITFPSFGRKLLGDDPVSLGASASSGLAVNYISSDPSIAQISGNYVILKKVGNTIITASQAGNLDYYPAAEVSQTLTVSQPVPSDYLTSRYNVTTVSGIQYRNVSDYKGLSASLAFDLYRRTSTPAVPQPVVILIHGGGYNASSADRTQSYIVSLGNELAARGFQALAIDYRLRATADRTTDATQLPALRDAAADALEAVKYVRANAGTYGWDPNAIFVLGGSAGGRIAAWLAVRESGDQGGLSTADPKSTTTPASSVASDASAVYDRSGMVASAVLFGGPEMSFRAYTVNSSDLPCIMIHGTYDGNTDQTGSIDTYGSVDLYNQLISAGVPAELHFLNGYGHQFDTSSGAYASVDAIPTVADLTVRFFIKEWERKLAGGTETFSPTVSKAGGSILTLTAPLATRNATGSTYQWKKDGVNLAGKTATTLVLNSLSAADNGSYSVTIGNPDRSWLSTYVSTLGFVNTPISGVNYLKTGLGYVNSHPDSLSLAVATVVVPSFVTAYPGESATSDVDGDGWVALVEYALGWSRAQGSAGKATIFPQSVVENGRLVLNYQVRANDPTVGVTPETSTDLSNPSSWSSGGVSVINFGNVTIGGEVLERRSASVPIDERNRFLHLRVDKSQ
jgi:acetyl esterase/lipase